MIGTAGFILQAPRGDGSPVVVLPGFTASDSSTFVLRSILERLGHRPVAWGLGRNVGPTREIIDGVDALVRRLHDEDGRSVQLVGWSLGGVLARHVAARRPDMVRRVITLGSPYRITRRQNLAAGWLYHPYAPQRRVPSGVRRGGAPRVPSRCRPPRSTRRLTASCPQPATPRRRPSSPRTLASMGATAAWRTTPWPSTLSPIAWHCPPGCCHGSTLREQRSRSSTCATRSPGPRLTDLAGSPHATDRDAGAVLLAQNALVQLSHRRPR